MQMGSARRSIVQLHHATDQASGSVTQVNGAAVTSLFTIQQTPWACGAAQHIKAPSLQTSSYHRITFKINPVLLKITD